MQPVSMSDPLKTYCAPERHNYMQTHSLWSETRVGVSQ
jgi:hypothetical protein